MLPLWPIEIAPPAYSNRNGWALRSSELPAVEYRTCPIAEVPGRVARVSRSKRSETSPIPTCRRNRLSSRATNPADSWPRCWRACMPRYVMLAASSWPWMPNTPHMAIQIPRSAEWSTELVEANALPYRYRERASSSLARCAGHRGIPRPHLGGDPGRSRDGLRHPDGRRDGLAPSLADLLGWRRLRPRGSVVGERRVLPRAARPIAPVQARRCGALRQPVAALRRHQPDRCRRWRRAVAVRTLSDDAAPGWGRDSGVGSNRSRRDDQPGWSFVGDAGSAGQRDGRARHPVGRRIGRRDPRAAPPRRAAPDRAPRVSRAEVQRRDRPPHGGSRKRSVHDGDRARQLKE